MKFRTAKTIQIQLARPSGTFGVRQVSKSLTAFIGLVLLSSTFMMSEARATGAVTRLKLNVEETDTNKCFELSKKSHYTGEHTFLKGRGYQVLQYNPQIRCLKFDPQLPFQTEATKTNPNICVCYGTLSVNAPS